jgi:WD40 repeat protein
MAEIALLNRNIEIKNVKLTSNLKEKKAEVMSLAFHKSVPYLAAGFTNKKAKISINGIDLYNLNGHTESVYSVAFHPKKLLIATGSRDTTVKLWLFSHYNRPQENNNIKAILTLTGHEDAVMSVAFYPKNDQIILATGSKDGTAKIWKISPNLLEATCISTIFEQDYEIFNNIKRISFLSVAFHPVYKILATGNSDNCARLWYLNDDFSLKNSWWHSRGITGAVNTVSFSPNGLYLATGSEDTKVILWKLEYEKEIAVRYIILNGHTEEVRSVSFCSFDSPDSSEIILATGSYDKSVKLWKILTVNYPKEECLDTLENNDGITSVAFFKNKFLATGCSDGTTKTYTLNFEKTYTANFKNNKKPTDKNKKTPNGPSKSSISNSLRNSAEPLAITEIRNNFEKKNYSEIKIPSKFSTPTKNSCPNFRDLYYSFMKTELPLNFIFKFEGQTGFDAGGLSKMVFDMIFKVYIHLFFEKIVNNNDFLILKEDINLRQLITDTKKLMLLANASTAKICLKIDPELLELCKLGVTKDDLKKYFTNEKKQFEKFYKNISNAIFANNTFNELNNNKNFLRNKNKNKNKNNIVKQYKHAINAKNDEIIESLKREIRLRRFAAKCGFKSWKQLENTIRFLHIFSFYPDSDYNEQGSPLDKKLWELYKKKRQEIFQKQDKNPNINIPDFHFLDFFDFNPQFDKASILSRVKCIMSSSRGSNINIEKISSELFRLYPALKPFVDYIIGPNSTDENRKKFVQFITGSEYSTDEIKIFLEDTEISSNRGRFRLPFEPPSTCFSYIILLKRPTSRNYNNELTEQRIDELILESILALTANNKEFNNQNNESSISSSNHNLHHPQENDNNRSSVSSSNSGYGIYPPNIPNNFENI